VRVSVYAREKGTPWGGVYDVMTQGYTATLVAAILGHQPLESLLSEEAARQAGESLVGSRNTITTGLTAESKIALRTRPSWLLQLT
jgi:hypothetical protein